MGRAISMENRQDDLDRRLKLVEKELRLTSDALEELVQNGTRVHHVDLTEEVTDERNVKAEGTKTTHPPVETKKTTRSVKKTVSA